MTLHERDIQTSMSHLHILKKLIKDLKNQEFFTLLSRIEETLSKILRIYSSKVKKRDVRLDHFLPEDRLKLKGFIESTRYELNLIKNNPSLYRLVRDPGNQFLDSLIEVYNKSPYN